MESFKDKVLTLTTKVPRGKITTYKVIADLAGNKKAGRAVGNILGKNERLIEIPCHRIIRADGSVGGYVKGSAAKINLLKSEGISVIDSKVRDFKNVFLNKSKLKRIYEEH